MEKERFENIANALKDKIDWCIKGAIIMETSPYRPSGKEEVKKYRENYGKLMHDIHSQLTLALIFGLNDQDGCVKIIDTEKLPSIEEAKKMSEEERETVFKNAEVDGRIKSTKLE